MLAIVKETGAPFATLFTVMAFGVAASFGGEPGKSARLLATCEMTFRQLGAKFTSLEGSPFVKVYKQALDKIQAQLGLAAFQAAWAEGQKMTLEQAIALATENESEDSKFPKT